jgi:drug/metabolite transporter (DMT)-like permease
MKTRPSAERLLTAGVSVVAFSFAVYALTQERVGAAVYLGLFSAFIGVQALRGRSQGETPQERFKRLRESRPNWFLWHGLMWAAIGVAILVSTALAVPEPDDRGLSILLGIPGGVFALLAGVSGLVTWLRARK